MDDIIDAPSPKILFEMADDILLLPDESMYRWSVYSGILSEIISFWDVSAESGSIPPRQIHESSRRVLIAITGGAQLYYLKREQGLLSFLEKMLSGLKIKTFMPKKIAQKMDFNVFLERCEK